MSAPIAEIPPPAPRRAPNRAPLAWSIAVGLGLALGLFDGFLSVVASPRQFPELSPFWESVISIGYLTIFHFIPLLLVWRGFNLGALAYGRSLYVGNRVLIYAFRFARLAFGASANYQLALRALLFRTTHLSTDARDAPPFRRSPRRNRQTINNAASFGFGALTIVSRQLQRRRVVPAGEQFEVLQIFVADVNAFDAVQIERAVAIALAVFVELLDRDRGCSHFADETFDIVVGAGIDANGIIVLLRRDQHFHFQIAA